MIEKPFTPCVLTSGQRASRIQQAQNRVILCSPGIGPREATALISVQQRLAPAAVRVLADFSPEAFRIGYWGDQSPADVAQLAGCLAHAEIAHGLRLGLLIVDDEGFIFVATAESLETKPADAQEPNALRLDQRVTEQLLESITSRTGESRVNRPRLTVEATKEVAQQVAARRVSKPTDNRLLDLMRQRICIVQFEVHGYQLSRRSLSLPPEIVSALGSKNQQISSRITASWRVFDADGANNAKTGELQKKVNEELTALKNKHLKSLSHYGFGLVLDEQPRFEAAWKVFQEGTVQGYRKCLLETVNALVQESRGLLKTLLQERADSGQLAVPHSPSLFPKPPEVERDNYIEWLLNRVKWPSAEEVSAGVAIKKRHYDLTADLLQDEEFIRELEKAFGDDFAQIRKLAEEKPASPTESKFSFSVN